MRKFAQVVLVLTALALLLVVGLGLWAQNSAQATKSKLNDQVNIAQQLQQMKAIAQENQYTHLTDSVEALEKQLSPAALELASASPLASAETSAAASLTASASAQASNASSVQARFTNSANQLLETALATSDSQLRYVLLSGSENIWSAALASKLVTDMQIPRAAQILHAQDNCQPAQNLQDPPESLKAVTDTLNQLTYDAAFYHARSDVDGYNADLAQAVSNINKKVALWRTSSEDVFACTYQLPAQAARYDLDAKAPQQTLDQLTAQLKSQVDTALLDSTLQDQGTLVQLLVLKTQLAS